MTESLFISRILFFSLATAYFSSLNMSGQDISVVAENKKNQLILTDSLNPFETNVRQTVFKNKTSLMTIDDSIKSKSDNFYDTLKYRAEKKKITREIIDLIIVTPSEDIGTIASESETPFIEYHNKTIRNISFTQFAVFGPTVDDTTKQTSRFYEKAGNKMHINTSKNILRKNLLIKPGDILNAYTIADNERIIRSLPFIHDVRFIIRPTSPLSDSVDIIVITKDLWSLGFGIEMSGVDKGKIGIWHENLFGFGNKQHNTIFWNKEEKHLLGYDGIYRINNLAGFFINSEFRFASYYSTRHYYANFQRSFFTPEIKYAGGLRIESKKTIQDIVLIDTVLLATKYNFTSFDFWAGRSFSLGEGSLLMRKRSNLMFAARVNNIYYHERPQVDSDYLYTFHNRIRLLATAALSKQGFYKSQLIYSFEQTEDIPYGYMIQLIGGYEFNEFVNRPYIGFALSHGTYLLRQGGYLFSKLETGGFLRNNYYDQGLFSISTNYFTPLFSLDRFKFRYFVNFNYKSGIRRFGEEYISIENKNGLTGLTSPYLKGIQKMTLNVEAVTFTPYYLMGFRFVFFGFADLGIIGPANRMIFDNKLFSGLGFGLRLRNERLVFNTLQIKFVFYPLSPEDAKWQYIQVSGEHKLQMNNFYISEPKIIEF